MSLPFCSFPSPSLLQHLEVRSTQCLESASLTPPPGILRYRVNVMLPLGFTSRTLSLMIPSPSLSNALKAPVKEEHTGQRPVTGSPPLHCCNFSSEDCGPSAVLQHKNVPGRVSTITLPLPAHSELTAGLYLCSAWIESRGTWSGPRARKGGPPLTEHAL